MKRLPTDAAAVKEINRHGALLIFPINNKKEPPSLWQVFFPRKKMNWEWSDDGDDAVPHFWHLRGRLSNSRKVVYTKWYQGRATVFSFKVFRAVLHPVATLPDYRAGLTKDACTLLEILEGDSPLGTKELRAAAELEGKLFESAFHAGMRQLWQRGLIVGFGEVDEGGFPSLAVGATKLIFEDLWDEAKELSPDERASILAQLPADSLFLKQLRRVERALVGAVAPQARAGFSVPRLENQRN